MKFINRKKEIEIIENTIKLSKKKIYSLVITGPRRVGKTRLILESFKNKKFLYFFIDENKGVYQILDEIKYELRSKNIIDEYTEIRNFRAFLDILVRNYKGTVVFDEFQNFYKINKSIFGEFQRFFDLYEDAKGLLFIFSGSLVGLIKKLMSKKAPLYGRIKRKITLKPLIFENVIEMCNNLKIKDFEEILKFYFIFSGFPRYYVAIEDEGLEGRTFNEIITKFFLEENAIFEDEIEKILSMEFGKRKNTFYAILERIASGKNTISEIASSLNLKSTSITRQLNELVNFFEFVRIEKQVVGKKRLYFIRYPLLEFWFRFFYKYLSLYKKREEEFIKLFWKDLNGFFGRRFEQFILENFNLFFKGFTKIGRQWGKIKGKPKGQNSYEIDILAINEKTKEILACECKWQSRVNAEKVVKELAEKLSYVDWHKDKRKESFAVFAKSFSKRINSYEGKRVYCYDLKDLEKVIKRKV